MTAAEAVKPKDRFQTPLIGRLEITEGKITYQDPKRKLDARRHDLDRDGQGRAQPQAELKLKGKLEGQPLTVDFTGGSAIMLRDTKEPYPIDLEVTFGGTKLTAKGKVAGSVPVGRSRRRSHAVAAPTSTRSTRCSASPARRPRPTRSAASSSATPACGSS